MKNSLTDRLRGSLPDLPLFLMLLAAASLPRVSTFLRPQARPSPDPYHLRIRIFIEFFYRALKLKPKLVLDHPLTRELVEALTLDYSVPEIMRKCVICGYLAGALIIAACCE